MPVLYAVYDLWRSKDSISKIARPIFHISLNIYLENNEKIPKHTNLACLSTQQDESVATLYEQQ